jgi:hypothetical protein
VAEGGGLLNRYTLQRRIEGSNPSVSANLQAMSSNPLHRRIQPNHRAANVATESHHIWKYDFNPLEALILPFLAV